MGIVNTSYDQRYVVVSSTEDTVTLRPIGEGLLQTYWQQFFSGRLVYSKEPPGPVTIRLQQAPPPVLRVDAYTALHIEYPRVVAVCDGVETDISSLVTSNKPNTDVPGLYIISYVLPLPGQDSNEVWRSYVSIEEPPLLRQAITPWNRDSYTIATLNRLLVEPQFQEALYEEGAPLYNFVTSNTSPALRPGHLAQAKKAIGVKSGRSLFLSGAKFPSASRIHIMAAHGAAYTAHIDRTITGLAWSAGEYAQGDVVTKGAFAYYAAAPITADDIPGSSVSWIQGHLYRLEEELGGGPDAEAWAREPDGALTLLSLWAWVDLRGYVFDIDVLHAPSLGTYWGYYDSRNFYDYRPGDLVSYISDGVFYVYRRNDTDIQDRSTEEAYRPGDFHNPHWDEAYAAYPGGKARDFDDWLAPVTNAANGVIVKTGSLSELMCSVYARMMGIPDSIVGQVGSKCSVFLYILLQRTRDTFEGFRNAFRAIGMGVEDLHRAYPTVEAVDGEGVGYPSVYAEADALKKVAQSIQAGKLFQGGMDPSVVQGPESGGGLPWVRYWPDPATALATKHHGPYAIQEYRGGSWNTIYEIEGFGDSYPQGAGKVRGNNRYYQCTVTLLSRLAKNALADLHDGKQWIGLGSYSGPISYAVADVCAYEVPMYIYLRAKLMLASICHAARQGVSSIRLHRGTYGGTPVLVLHPYQYFDFATGLVKAVYPTVQVFDGSEFVDRAPDEVRGSARTYVFGQAARLKFLPPEGYSWAAGGPCWTSRNTMGLLGDNSVEPPIDGSELDTDEMDLHNGIVGATMVAALGAVTATLEYLAWNYIFHDGSSLSGSSLGSWELDEETPFASMAAGECEVFATWAGDSLAPLLADGTYAIDGDGNQMEVEFTEDGSAVHMDIAGRCPRMIYIYSAGGNLLAYARAPVQALEGPSSNGEGIIARITFALGA